MRRPVWIIVALLVLGLWLWSQQDARLSAPARTAVATQPERTSAAPASDPAAAAQYPEFLPPEAHEVLRRIARGGPFEYRQDGGVFQNREGRLPPRPRGYYREYTVETPGSGDRGARRIVTGGDPAREYWYTEDHYRSFTPFEVSP